jgi:putative ABC transport system permease protein
LSNIIQDIRYAIRQLRAHPGFALIAVLTLALGIGANSAIFSLANALFMRSLPGERPAELVSLYTSDFSGPLYGLTSYRDFIDLQGQNDTLSGLICYTPFPAVLTMGEQTDRVYGEFVSVNYFDVLGLHPQTGRWFLAEEGRDGEIHQVTVISDAMWTRRFQRNPAVIGSTLHLGGGAFTIVGVAPAGFSSLIRGFASDFWVPMAAMDVLQRGSHDLTNRGSRGLFVIGRLRPGVSIDQARANFRVLAAQHHDAYPREWEDRNQQPRVLSLLPESESRVFPMIRGPILGFIAFLMMVVGLVLLIACSNIANLMLARSAARRKEIAVRLSVGASRARLLQQLLTESLLLSLAGGAAGLSVAALTRGALAGFQPPVPVPLALDLHVDGKVLLFTLVIAVGTGLMFGLAPAVQSVRADISDALKNESARGMRRGRLRSTLVVAQLALSLLLLIGSGLFLRSLSNASSIDPGFDPKDLLMMSIDLQPQGYEEVAGRALYPEIVDRLKSIPGVTSASLAELIDLGLSNQRRGVTIEGYTPKSGEDMEVAFNRVGPHFLETMKIGLVRGRSFTEADTEGAPRVAIINQSFANKYLPGQDPIGKRIDASGDQRWMEVIGITKDGKYRTLGEEPRPFLYLPLYQNYQPSVTFVLRTAANAGATVAAARAEIAALDKTLPVYDVKTGEEHMRFALLPARLAGSLLGILGGLALVLAAIGIYGVMSFSVVQRTREMGIRIALGAPNVKVLGLVVGQGMRLASIGMVIGAAVAVAVTRFAAIFLYGISPTDPLTFFGIAGLLGAVAFLACYIPARRATRVDPMIALRSE